MGKRNNVSTQSVRVSKGKYSPTMEVGIIECDTTNNPITIVLPNILSSNADDIGYSLVIQDVGNNASNNNITILVSGREKVNGATSLVINTDGGVVKGNPFGDFYWSFSSSNTSGGGGGDTIKPEKTYRANISVAKGGAITETILRNDYEATASYEELSLGVLGVTHPDVTANSKVTVFGEKIVFDGNYDITDRRICRVLSVIEGAFILGCYFNDSEAVSYNNRSQISQYFNDNETWIQFSNPQT